MTFLDYIQILDVLCVPSLLRLPHVVDLADHIVESNSEIFQ